MVTKVLAIKAILYILNLDMIDKRPRSGVKLYKSYKNYSQQTKLFLNFAIKLPILNQWCNFEVFITISLKSKIFPEVAFIKISGFYYK